MKTNWQDEGVKAGKTDGWMRLDESVMEEDLERHPKFARDPGELVTTAEDGWEATTHFEMKYGSGMVDDARDEETGEFDPDAYIDNKTAFWEGFEEGQASLGKDKSPYAIAKRLIDKKYGKGKTGYKVVPKSGKKKSRARSVESSIGGVR